MSCWLTHTYLLLLVVLSSLTHSLTHSHHAPPTSSLSLVLQRAVVEVEVRGRVVVGGVVVETVRVWVGGSAYGWVGDSLLVIAAWHGGVQPMNE